MTVLRILILTTISISLYTNVLSQDSLYAKKIDSLWFHSYDRKILSKKWISVSGVKIGYFYYKSSGKIRSITILNKPTKENVLLFFVQDKIVMISPSGQQPYFILNDEVVYAKEYLHTTEQIQGFITKAYDYLSQVYLTLKP